MSFIKLDIKDIYNTDEDSIPHDFYDQVFPETKEYKRAAGFFSSSAFETFGKGLLSFYENGGNMRLLVSPWFSKEDKEAIEMGYKAQEDLAVKKIIEAFDINENTIGFGVNILAWLIYEKRLEIRIVVRKDKKRSSLFHDKFSILVDEDNNRITYRGSMNESEQALDENYETIEVDWSWDTKGINRVLQREKKFDEIWESGGLHWKTVKFPNAIEEKLIKIRKPIEYLKDDDDEPIMEVSKEKEYDVYPRMPNDFKLRDYQKEAISKWLKNSNKGIFEMATGTGKTKTALSAITKVLDIYYKNSAKCGLVIVVPYSVLLEQWIEDLSDFNIYPIMCYESRKKWEHRLNDAITLFNAGVNRKLFVITTNKTFGDNCFNSLISSISGDYIFCVDEMHHLATERQISALPDNAKFRLGLSATLMNKYKTKELEQINDYFNGIVYTYSMKEAIAKGALVKYYYEPVFVELTDYEKEEYYEISEKISNIMKFHNNEMDFEDGALTALLNQRARIIASAENKINKLREYKDVLTTTCNNIVYCGDRIEADEKFISKVTALLQDEMGVCTAKFTSEQNKEERRNILKLFGEETIKTITAIRCLDEGVDIPQLERAFIMSSGSNPKEYIQRRGRVLRRNGDKKQFAYIYDFIVIPTMKKEELDDIPYEVRQVELKIISREYERLKEFAALAENGVEATAKFIEVWQKYFAKEKASNE